MALKQAPAEINVDDWNRFVHSLGFEETSSPDYGEVRLFRESASKWVLKVYGGSTWKVINDFTQAELLAILGDIDAKTVDGRRIETGQELITYRTGSTTVTFNQAFTSTPEVLLSAGPENTTDNISYYIKTISTTGFTAGGSATGSHNATYLAIGG